MKRAIVILLTVALSLMPSTVVEASECSAECNLCPSASPTCSASCPNASAHCQDGSCGGLYLGCCCIRPGKPNLCLSTPCGDPGGGGFPEKAGFEAGDWTVFRWTDEGDAEALFASSTAFATTLGSSGNSAPPSVLSGSTTAFVLAPIGKGVELEPKRHKAFLKSIQQTLEARLLEAGQGVAGIMAVRFDRDGPRALFSTDPFLEDLLLPGFGPDLVHGLEADAGLEGDAVNPVDVFLLEIDDEQLSLVHVRFDRQPAH